MARSFENLNGNQGQAGALVSPQPCAAAVLFWCARPGMARWRRILKNFDPAQGSRAESLWQCFKTRGVIAAYLRLEYLVKNGSESIADELWEALTFLRKKLRMPQLQTGL